MDKARFSTGKMPKVSIAECSGDIVVRGWSEPEVLVKGTDFQVDEKDSGLTIVSKSSLSLMIPAGASLSVVSARGDLVVKNLTGSVNLEDIAGDARLRALGDLAISAVHGDLSVKSLEGSAKVGSIHGDAIVRSTGDVEIETVYGDLSARYVKGNTRFGEIMGDMSLRNVEGDVFATKVFRDANLHDVSGNVSLSDIQGDIRLSGGLGDGKNSLTAEGDVIVRWPKDAPLTLTASAEKITNKLTLDELHELDGTLSGRIGSGGAHLAVTAKGRIILRDAKVASEKWEWELGGEEEFGFSVELDGLGDRISMQVNEHIARMATELENRFGPEHSQRLAEQVAKKAEMAAQKAERVAQKAMQRAERSMRRTERRGRRRRAAPAAPQKKKASHEEQLKILKMVEQGIITTDEASTLLEALES